jgi:putative glutamine amidotransferase
MKKVLIITAHRSIPGYSRSQGVFVLDTYLKKMTDLKIVPVLAPPTLSRKMLDQLYIGSSGVHFIGGSDIAPEHYHAKKDPQTNACEKDRDKAESYILKKVLRDKKPFFGICRGLQNLVVAAGGTLYQHLPNIVKNETHHIDTQAGKLYEDINDNRHTIDLKVDSRAFRIVREKSFSVNSAHHQAAKTLGRNLVAAAYSPAGIIEVVEHRDTNRFCFAVQCHPELENSHPIDKIYKEFYHSILRFRS